jgi:hypothetical protein
LSKPQMCVSGPSRAGDGLPLLVKTHVTDSDLNRYHRRLWTIVQFVSLLAERESDTRALVQAQIHSTDTETDAERETAGGGRRYISWLLGACHFVSLRCLVRSDTLCGRGRADQGGRLRLMCAWQVSDWGGSDG